jgi:hypothetical protein
MGMVAGLGRRSRRGTSSRKDSVDRIDRVDRISRHYKIGGCSAEHSPFVCCAAQERHRRESPFRQTWPRARNGPSEGEVIGQTDGGERG